MHIADWDESFLSQLSPEAYVENLKRAKIKSAMIYFQSHVGLCYYPTKSGKLHAAFYGKEDTMRKLMELCHKEGIAVTGYYSLIYNTVEHDRHPEWRLINAEGNSARQILVEGDDRAELSWESASSRYGHCCPNNEGYLEFCKTQIKEMAEYFKGVDGMFYDMLFWPQICYCDACKARWAREVGTPIPTKEDWQDASWLLHMRKRREWIGEFAKWVTDTTKKYFGDISVTHNVAYSALSNPLKASAEEVISACDYAGGDIYVTMYTQSFACKFFRSITKTQPFEYMISRCSPGLRVHTQLKSEDVLRSAVFLTAANHGASLIIDAIDPVGTLDGRVYDRIGKIFGELEHYEKYLVGEPIEDIGVYYSLKSKFSLDGNKNTNYTGCVNTVETCIRKNILCGITGGYRALDKHKLVILPMPTGEDDYDVKRIAEYVEGGGLLYFSGAYNERLLDIFFGAKYVGPTKESVTYVSPEESAKRAFGHFNKKYPLSFEESAPIVKGISDECVLARITLPYTTQNTGVFASIHSNPPGISSEIPALAITNYGKGRVLWSAHPMESYIGYDYRNIFIEILKEHLGFESLIESDAPYDVELTLFKDNDRYLLSSVLLSSEENARRLSDFTVRLKPDMVPKAVVKLSSDTEIGFSVNEGELEIKVEAPELFEMFEIK